MTCLTPFQLATLFVLLVAAASFANARTLRLPREVAMLLVGLIGALVLWVSGHTEPSKALSIPVLSALGHIDFANTVLGYMLGFLLFAGAMQVDLAEMRKRLASIAVLATAGVCASIIIVGVGLQKLAMIFGLPLSLPSALIFGALISPTDPIAVLATVKRSPLPKRLLVTMQGEALFNDGVGIVAFTSLVALAAGREQATPSAMLLSVFVNSAGGLLFGLLAGVIVIRAMRAIDDFAVEVMLSIALCMGVYAGAQALGLSGPIGVVGAGLLLGDERLRGTMSETTRLYLRSFWTLIDELLNALLFLLLGLEILIVAFPVGKLGFVAAAIVLVLFARVCVAIGWAARLRHNALLSGTIFVWGGLHGALSLALGLSVPPGPEKPTILSLTYAVVAFSIVVQGLTFEPLRKALERRSRQA